MEQSLSPAAAAAAAVASATLPRVVHCLRVLAFAGLALNSHSLLSWPPMEGGRQARPSILVEKNPQ